MAGKLKPYAVISLALPLLLWAGVFARYRFTANSENALSSNTLVRESVLYGYVDETRQIEQLLKRTVAVDCAGTKNEVDATTWYCNAPQFFIDAVEPYQNKLYATGSGMTDSKNFWWIAIKNAGAWNEIIFEDQNKTLPDCESMRDVPIILFNAKFTACQLPGGQTLTCERETFAECLANDVPSPMQ